MIVAAKMRRHPMIVVINQSTVLRDTEVQVAIGALQYQIDNHWQPRWNSAATLRLLPKDAPIPDKAWAAVISDDSDQAGALGYHDITHSGNPIGFVFAKTDMDYNLSWTVTASHELLEMLGDPYANIGVQINDNTWVAYESCDAVEADELGYDIGGTLVSDFMLPSWFEVKGEPPFDFAGHCKAPLTLLPGGYIGVWQPSTGWRQVTHGNPRHRDGARFQLRKNYQDKMLGQVTLG
jgi:hypothetical protein